MKSVLFYSFKGGVGRTQTMLNVAKNLSSNFDKKILIVDFDICAPGISYLIQFGKKEIEEYLIGFLLKTFNEEKSKFFCQELNKNIFVIPSSNVNNLEVYHSELTELSQYLYNIKKSADDRDKYDGSSVADDLYRYIIKSINDLDLDFDYVFFDSRTGITEVSDILFSNLLDLKVIVSSYNTQNIIGSENILRLLSKQLGKKHDIMRVLSPKPNIFEEKTFKDISLKANLEDDLILRNKFNWHGLFEIPYEHKIVTNDLNAWDELDNTNLYKKHIMSLSREILKVFENEKDLEIILKKIINE